MPAINDPRVSKVETLLRRCAKYFGPRCPNVKVHSVERMEDGAPHVRLDPDGVTICVRDGNEFDLAHEVAHVALGPGLKEETTVLTEGLCEVFVSVCQLRRGNEYHFQYSRDLRYGQAEFWVWQLLDQDAFCIQKMRVIQPRVNRITPDIILWTVSGVRQKTADLLCRPMIESFDYIPDYIPVHWGGDSNE